MPPSFRPGGRFLAIWLDAFSLAKYHFAVNHKKSARKIEDFHFYLYFTAFFSRIFKKMKKMDKLPKNLQKTANSP